MYRPRETFLGIDVSRPPLPSSKLHKAKRWGYTPRPDAACLANTKSEAIAFFKRFGPVDNSKVSSF